MLLRGVMKKQSRFWVVVHVIEFFAKLFLSQKKNQKMEKALSMKNYKFFKYS